MEGRKGDRYPHLSQRLHELKSRCSDPNSSQIKTAPRPPLYLIAPPWFSFPPRASARSFLLCPAIGQLPHAQGSLPPNPLCCWPDDPCNRLAAPSLSKPHHPRMKFCRPLLGLWTSYRGRRCRLPCLEQNFCCSNLYALLWPSACTDRPVRGRARGGCLAGR